MRTEEKLKLVEQIEELLSEITLHIDEEVTDKFIKAKEKLWELSIDLRGDKLAEKKERMRLGGK